MTSLSKKTESIRKRKVRKSGKVRKVKIRAGTTPRFPIHIEGTDETALPQPPGSDPKETR